MIINREWLIEEKACADAMARYDGEPIELSKLIRKLDRADWLLWLLWHSKSVSIRQMVWLACKCGRLSLRHVPKGEDRPRLAFEAAEAWVSDPTEVAENAAWAAGHEAWAAGHAAWAAAWAAGHAAGVAENAAGAAGHEAGAAEHKNMCAIIRAELRKESFMRLA